MLISTPQMARYHSLEERKLPIASHLPRGGGGLLPYITRTGYNISNARKLQFCKQPTEIIQGQIAFKNTVQCVNKQTAVLLLNPGTEYKRLAQMLERGISFKANSRTGCQFGVPGGTYPPKKYPSAPPPGLTSKAREKRPGDEVAIACGDTPVT